MSDELWFAALLLFVFVIYVIARVIGYMRQSERQWQRVDQSRLKTLDDDDEDR